MLISRWMKAFASSYYFSFYLGQHISILYSSTFILSMVTWNYSRLIGRTTIRLVDISSWKKRWYSSLTNNYFVLLLLISRIEFSFKEETKLKTHKIKNWLIKKYVKVLNNLSGMTDCREMICNQMVLGLTPSPRLDIFLIHEKWVKSTNSASV